MVNVYLNNLNILEKAIIKYSLNFDKLRTRSFLSLTKSIKQTDKISYSISKFCTYKLKK